MCVCFRITGGIKFPIMQRKKSRKTSNLVSQSWKVNFSFLCNGLWDGVTWDCEWCAMDQVSKWYLEIFFWILCGYPVTPQTTPLSSFDLIIQDVEQTSAAYETFLPGTDYAAKECVNKRGYDCQQYVVRLWCIQTCIPDEVEEHTKVEKKQRHVCLIARCNPSSSLLKPLFSGSGRPSCLLNTANDIQDPRIFYSRRVPNSYIRCINCERGFCILLVMHKHHGFGQYFF